MPIVILLIIAVAAVGVVYWAVFKPGSEETALKAGVVLWGHKLKTGSE